MEKTILIGGKDQFFYDVRNPKVTQRHKIAMSGHAIGYIIAPAAVVQLCMMRPTISYY